MEAELGRAYDTCGEKKQSVRAFINKLELRCFITHKNHKQDYSVRGARLSCACVLWMGKDADHWIHREENVTAFSEYTLP